MALDRQNRTLTYVAGRMIAIMHHYAGHRFGSNTIPTMITHPQYGLETWHRYIDKNDEYYQELRHIPLPASVKDNVSKGQIWIGYYHQMYEYNKIK